LVAVGDALTLAQSTADLLSEDGTRALVINLRSVKPLDTRVLVALGEACSHVFTFENGSRYGGVGAAISQALAEKPARIINFGYPDSFVPHGDTDLLKKEIGFDPESLAARIRQYL